MATLRFSHQGASRFWEVAKSHGGLYSGGKVALFSPEGRPVMGCLYAEDVAFVDMVSGQVITMLQDDNEAEVSRAAAEQEDQTPREVITTFCLNPRQGEIVTTSRSMLIRQWSVNLEAKPHVVRCVRSLKGHAEPVLSMDFDSSGTFVATGSADRTARVGDMRGGFATHNFRGRSSMVSLVQFHPDPQRLMLVTASDDCQAKIWSLHDKSCVATLGSHMSVITSLAFSSDGYTMATGSRDKCVNFWELRRHTLLKTLPVFEEVEGLAIIDAGPSGDGVADASGGRVAKKRKRLTEEASGTLVTVGAKGAARAWRFEPRDPSTLADHSRSGGRDDLLRCTVVATQPPSSGAATPYLCLARGAARVFPEALVAATADHNLVFIDPVTLATTRQIVGYNDEVLSLAHLGGPEARLAVATNSPHLKLLRLHDMSCEVLEGHKATIMAVDASPAGDFVVTGSKDRTCRLWDVASRSCVLVCVGHTQSVGAVALSRKPAAYDAGTTCFFSASGDRTLKRWRLDCRAVAAVAGSGTAPIEPKAERTCIAHQKDINMIVVAPNDAMVASCSQDKTARVWSTSDLSLLGTLRGHKRGVMALAFSPVNKSAATCSGDRTVKVWSLGDWSCLRTFQGHSGSVLQVSFLSSGTQLVSAGSDGLLKLWTIKTNECEATFDKHGDKVWALSMSADGSQLVTGGADSVINVWRDVTESAAAEEMLEAEAKVLKEHDLMASIHARDFQQAVDLAFELGHSLRLWHVFSDVLETAPADQGDRSRVFDAYVCGWGDDRVATCLGFIREWNTNATKATVAQALLGSVLRSVPLSRMRKIEGAAQLVDGLVAYTERHLQRLGRLATACVVIDYTCSAMSVIGVMPPADDGRLNEGSGGARGSESE